MQQQYLVFMTSFCECQRSGVPARRQLSTMIKLKHVSLGNRWDFDYARGKVEDFEYSLIFPPVQMYK